MNKRGERSLRHHESPTPLTNERARGTMRNGGMIFATLSNNSAWTMRLKNRVNVHIVNEDYGVPPPIARRRAIHALVDIARQLCTVRNASSSDLMLACKEEARHEEKAAPSLATFFATTVASTSAFLHGTTPKSSATCLCEAELKGVNFKDLILQQIKRERCQSHTHLRFLHLPQCESPRRRASSYAAI